MSRSSTLSSIDLKKFCDKQHLPFHLVNLPEIGDAPKYSFVFTGDNADGFNGGYHHHWLFLYGDRLFDSYSYQSKYRLPENIKPVELNPRILEQFGSNVCGAYVCAFYWFIKNIPNLDFENIGNQFVHYFHLGTDRAENDQKINTWFDNITK